ncbi:OmpA family protein [Myxococcota bacterium]|nr:OmpA family protein [Myxococcota bacterium]MBU1898510.1 OmpA family protein [Myxococcota bacterium]
MSRHYLLWGGALLSLTFSLGCVGGAALRGRANTISEKLKEIEKPAYKCAEVDLAVAQSELQFAQLELAQGAYLRAAGHLEKSSAATLRAEKVAPLPQCQENSDRDGDGVFDRVDLCPDDPEDKDNYEDEDGCPEDQDSDGDGLPDSKDQCPNDPEDFDGVEDEDGCPDLVRDQDKDGIADEVDKCPTQPEDKDKFEDEDGCPDPDNDQDGILDQNDKCPLQAEDKDKFEDEDGCPDTDNDKDRIIDEKDQCPNEPEDYDGDTDEDGCPDIYKSIIVKDDRIELKQKIFFQTAKARILSKSFSLLNEVAMALKDKSTVRVRIEGHTDSQGSAKYNKKLSQQRADSVRRYLIGQGIDGDRLDAEGFGEDQPLEDNRTPEGRAANRRVEFIILK